MDDYVSNHERLRRAQAGPTFLQGSYKNDTLIRPLRGDFDVDVAYPITRDFATELRTSAGVLGSIGDALAEDDDYRRRMERKNSCIRIHYRNDFHLDFVPLRTTSPPYPHEVADGVEWKITTPREFDGWVHTVNSKECNGRFVRAVKFLKRWRDVHFALGDRTPSLALTAFAGTHHPYRSDVRHRFPKLATQESDSDAAFLRDLVIIMEDCISRQHRGFTLPNPVREKEDLARRLSEAQLHALRVNLIAARDVAREAYAEKDIGKSAELWRRLLGEDFPLS